jgi:integral membrane sensor domain MASE1
MLQKIINLLERKGIIATLIGLLFALPINIRIVYAFYKNIELSNGQLMTACVMNCIACVWFILPSAIIIKSKLMSIEIKD